LPAPKIAILSRNCSTLGTSSRINDISAARRKRNRRNTAKPTNDTPYLAGQTTTPSS